MTIYPRNRRHASPLSSNHEDNFGFVSNGVHLVSSDDHSRSYHGSGRSHAAAQTRQKKQAVGNGIAPHARPNVSHS